MAEEFKVNATITGAAEVQKGLTDIATAADKAGDETVAAGRKMEAASQPYAKLRQSQVQLTEEFEKGAKSARNSGQAALGLSNAIQDFDAAGMKGAINNVAQFVQGLTGSAGLAGAAMVSVIAIDKLITLLDDTAEKERMAAVRAEAYEIGLKAQAKAMDEAKDRGEALADSLALQTAAYDALNASLDRTVRTMDQLAAAQATLERTKIESDPTLTPQQKAQKLGELDKSELERKAAAEAAAAKSKEVATYAQFQAVQQQMEQERKNLAGLQEERKVAIKTTGEGKRTDGPGIDELNQMIAEQQARLGELEKTATELAKKQTEATEAARTAAFVRDTVVPIQKQTVDVRTGATVRREDEREAEQKAREDERRQKEAEAAGKKAEARGEQENEFRKSAKKLARDFGSRRLNNAASSADVDSLIGIVKEALDAIEQKGQETRENTTLIRQLQSQIKNLRRKD